MVWITNAKFVELTKQKKDMQVDEQKLKEMLDKAESMGFQRGVRELLIAIGKYMMGGRWSAVTFDAMKIIHDDLLKK